MTDATKALERALDVIRPLILSKPKVAITLAVLIAVLTVIGAGTVVAEVWGLLGRSHIVPYCVVGPLGQGGCWGWFGSDWGVSNPF